MSQLYVDNIRNRTGGPIGIPTGAVVTGVVTATSFVGSGEGLTGVASTNNIVTGTAATFTAGVNISGSSNVSITGVITATSFKGSGALLTGLPAGFTELDAALFN